MDIHLINNVGHGAMHNLKIIRVLILILASILFMNSNSVNASSISDLVHSFEQARKTGNVKAMRVAINELVKAGALKLGMTDDQVIKILGKPDTGSGIYVPGGHSIGYGLGEPGVDYHTFFWLHFREIDWQSDDPKGPLILLGWDVPVREE